MLARSAGKSRAGLSAAAVRLHARQRPADICQGTRPEEGRSLRSACHRPPGLGGWGCWGHLCGSGGGRGVHGGREAPTGPTGGPDVQKLLARLEGEGKMDWITRDKQKNKNWLVQEIPENMRNMLICEKIYRSHRSRVGDQPRQLCGRCGLQNRYCICAKSAQLTAEVVAAFPHRILLYSHVKELGRASNTGGLVRLALGTDKTDVIVADVQEQEDRLDAELARDPARTVVLFPSEDSVTVQEFLSTPSEATGEHAPSQHAKGDSKGLTIFLVDGTWSQARRLVRRFPSSIKRVRLSEETLSTVQELALNSPMRDQVEPDRVCSLTALAYVLRDLQVSEEVPTHLLELLRIKSEVVLEMSDKEWKPNKVVSSHTPKARAEGGTSNA